MTECTHEHFFACYGKPADQSVYGSYKICLNCGERFGFEADDGRDEEEEM